MESTITCTFREKETAEETIILHKKEKKEVSFGTVSFSMNTIHDCQLIRLQAAFDKTIVFDADDTIRLTVETGMHPDGITALYMLNDWWTRPAFLSSFQDIPERTQVLFIHEENMSHCILALTGNIFKTSLTQGTDTAIQVKVFSGMETLKDFDEPVILIGSSKSIREAADKAMKAMAELNHLPLLGERAVPDMLQYLGWCSWDAFYQDVNGEGLIEKAKELKEKHVPVNWFLIDDGWLSTEGKKLTAYEPDQKKFPGGFKPFLNRINEITGIKRFGVWHAVCGYWEGIANNNNLDKEDLYETKEGNLFPNPYDAENFYHKWYEYLKNEGISFVKVDGQSTVPFFFQKEIPYPASMAGIMKGIESASEIFHHDVINCMGMAMESINARKVTGVSRNSNDFVPTFGEEGFKEHLLQNAYNSLYHNAYYMCDWDMFWTSADDATKHGLLRAASGGPLYFSDRVGETNADAFKPMIYTDGKILMLERSLMPTDDCVFMDPLKDGILKLHNYGKQADLYAGGLALFNLTEETKDWTFQIKEISELNPSQEYVLYDWFNQKVLPRKEVYQGTMKPGEYQWIVIVPKGKNMSLFGRMDKYAGFTSVNKWEENPEFDKITMQETGPFGWCSAQMPKCIKVNGKDYTDTIQCKDGLYTLPLEVEDEPAEILFEW